MDIHPSSSRLLLLLVCCGLWIAYAPCARAATSEAIELTIDSSEADQVLAILGLRQAGKPIAETDWQKLFATMPYQRFKVREQKIAEQFHSPDRDFSDEDFKKFVLSSDLLNRATQLRETLERWKQADLRHSAERVLAYLPEGAVIHAKVYPMIKPGRNSFVWDLKSDPTIFLYLDPAVTRDKFENTVAHELHHIGLGSLGPVYDDKIAALTDTAHTAADWMGAFGEGLAMLAAAGGPDADPHAASTPKEHATWDKQLANFDSDLPEVDKFFLDVLSGKLDKNAADAKGGSFFGSAQGPWYTVGYTMAVMVEKRYGRPALIRSMLDFRCLPALYNQIAAEQNTVDHKQRPLWSETVLSQVGATTCGVAAISSPDPRFSAYFFALGRIPKIFGMGQGFALESSSRNEVS